MRFSFTCWPSLENWRASNPKPPFYIILTFGPFCFVFLVDLRTDGKSPVLDETLVESDPVTEEEREEEEEEAAAALACHYKLQPLDPVTEEEGDIHSNRSFNQTLSEGEVNWFGKNRGVIM